MAPRLAVLVLILGLLASAEGLKCAGGIIISGSNSTQAAVSIDCSNDNAQCVEFTGGYSSVQYRIFFCTSFRIAANEFYGTYESYVCQVPDNYFGLDPSMCFCNNTDNCNLNFASLPSVPNGGAASGSRQCYNGIVDRHSPNLRGGIDRCDGLCVTYTYYSGQSNVYGCAPAETRTQLGAVSDNSCVYLGDLSACFCTGDLCNAPATLYPTPAPNLTCYSGFGYGTNYYGSVEVCRPDEVCAGFQYGNEIVSMYSCEKADVCFAYWSGDFGTLIDPCQWTESNGQLVQYCCCANNLCNYNQNLMGQSGSVPTPNPTTNNHDIMCLDGFQWISNYPQSPLVGEYRPCQGSCIYTEYNEFFYSFRQWRCMDADVCTSLGIDLGTCKSGTFELDEVCCFENATSSFTTRTTRPPTTSTTTSRPKTCPNGWTTSTSVTNKCYFSTGASATSWPDAQSICTQLISGGNLVSIQNTFENTEVANGAQTSGYFWIGLQNIGGTWQYSDGKNVTYTNWAPGEPSDGQGCARVQKSSRRWYADSCNGGENDIACEIFL